MSARADVITEKNEVLDVTTALDAFEKIRENGEKVGEWWILGDVRAKPSFDGYTVYMADDNGQLSIFFHNKFAADFESTNDYENFLRKLDKIECTQYQSH